MRGKLTLTSKFFRWYKIFKIKNQGSGLKAIRDMIQVAVIRAVNGIRISEQHLYHYKKLSKSKRESLFYVKDNARFIDLINDSKSIYLLRDKSILLKRLKIEIGRRFLYTPDSDYEALLRFIYTTNKFILKPNALGGGRGIEVASVDGSNIVCRRNANTKQGSIEQFANQWIDEDIVLEEYINQHEDLNKIYPLSVNSIRIHTVNINGDVDIVYTHMIRFGSNNGNIDFDNGLTLLVDERGRLGEHAIQVLDDVSQTKIFTAHPDTGIYFKDYQIPYWQQVQQLVIDTAKKVPEVCYIGWDVAITDKGPVIIEGNGAPASHSGIQLHQLKFGELSVKKQLSTLLKQTLYRKKLTLQKIKMINKKLFMQSDVKHWNQCTHVIVLGSYDCKYRIERAYQLFGSQSVKYILCGKNLSAYAGQDNLPLTESEFMQLFLETRGVAAEQIVVENNSTNTQQNIDIAFSMFCTSETIGRVGVITGGFHMRRVYEIISKSAVANKVKNNIVYIPAYGNHTKPDNWYKTFKGTSIILNELRTFNNV